jgi:signal transduction histidine kinase/CheY-like chemotaxis protein
MTLQSCGTHTNLSESLFTRSQERPVSGVQEAGINTTEQRHVEDRLRELNSTLERRASKLRTLAAQLIQAEQRDRRRLAIVLHDHLQQLLFAARMKSGLMRRQTGEATLPLALAQLDEMLDQAIAASRTLALELSPPVLYDAGLATALDWLARHVGEEHGLTVALEISSRLDPVDEPIRVFLFQAVRELLANVVKHARTDQARVCADVVVDGDEQQIRVIVCDEGAGFDPVQLATTRGIGLFALRERLEMLGGQLEIESRSGHGTRVALSVPYGSTESQLPAAAVTLPVAVGPQTARKAGGSKRIRVLVADDHPILRKGLVDLVREQADFELVGEASDGEEAVALALEKHPDIVLMDVTMPRLDGLGATRRITAALSEVRVIGLSMHQHDDMAQAMREAGAVAYLTKGGSADELLAAIRTARNRG